jgi:hypothetical protein
MSRILTDLKDDTTDRRESSWPDRRPAAAEGQNRPRRTVETEGGRAARPTAEGNRIDDEQDRKLARLVKVHKKPSNLIPRRSPATIAVSEVATLVSKFVTNRAQAEKLVAEIRKLSE